MKLTAKYPMKVASYYFHIKKHMKMSTEAYEKMLVHGKRLEVA